MANPAPRAGGVFIVLAILTGFTAGMLLGEPVLGTLGGTIIGVLIAVGLWLTDRRRAGR